MTRLGLFTRPGPSNSNSDAKPGSFVHPVEGEEEWYIPYKGPREPTPESRREELERAARERESWGEMLHEWLSDDDHGGEDAHGRYNTKANASTPNLERTHSRSESNARPRKYSSTANSSNMAHNKGFIDLGRAGGVGECPLPVERAPTHYSSASTSEESSPQQKVSSRASLASIFTFGRKSLRLSLSMENITTGNLSRQPSGRLRTNSSVEPSNSPKTRDVVKGSIRRRANTSIRQPDRFADDLREEPEDEYYNSYYSTLIATPAAAHTSPPNSAGAGTNSSMRSHPYAYPFLDSSSPHSAPASATPTQTQHNEDKQRTKTRLITLLDPRSSSRIPEYLKPSPRNSILKASFSTPNLRNAQAKIAKGKQRWLAAETWCDAIFLPRPRFAMRLAEPGNGESKSGDSSAKIPGVTGIGTGRIVSPPASVIPTPRGSPSLSHGTGPIGPTSVEERAMQVRREMKSPKRVRSLGNLIGDATRKGKGKERETITEDEQEESRANAAVGEFGSLEVDGTQGGARAERPKSWALDDLALPSPVPSLAKVLEEGRQLEMDRRTWKRTASKSFFDSTARSISRARSKSVSGGTASAATLTALRFKQKEGEAEAYEGLRQSKFETLKGRTLERTLIGGQVRPPTIHVRGPSTARRRSRSRDGTGTQTLRGSGTQTHTFRETQTGTVTHTATRSHAHSNSLGNSISISDATHAHSYGRNYSHGRSQSLSKSAIKLVAGAAVFCGVGGQSPAEERKESDVITGAIDSPATRHLRLGDQMAEDATRSTSFGSGNDGSVIFAKSSPSPNTGLTIPGPNNTHAASPASSEEIGVAISSPLDHALRQQHAGREPIRIQHPYARSAGYFDQEPTNNAATVEQGQEENMYRQPVLMHPYASASSRSRTQTNALPSTYKNMRPPHLHVPTLDVSNSIFAELTPGHVREFDAQEIRYSPEVRTPLIVPPAPQAYGSRDETEAVDTGTIYVRPPPSVPHSPLPRQITTAPQYVYDRALSGSGAVHPFGASSKRTSELMFGDALARTLSMRRGSLDSGLGTSEAGHVAGNGGDEDQITQNHSSWQPQPSYYAINIEGGVEESPDADAVDDIVRTHDMYDSTHLGEPSYFSASGSTAGLDAQPSPGMLSNGTHASSPLENIIPPAFRRTASGVSGVSAISMISNVSLPMSLKERLNRNGNSSGSSPGMTSHESSPPLSPHPINTMDDLDRFRDLFYRPPDSVSTTSFALPVAVELDGREGQSRHVSTTVGASIGLRDSIAVPAGGPTGSGVPVDISPPNPSRRGPLLGLARRLSEDLQGKQMGQQSPSMSSQYSSDLASPHANPDHPIMWGRRQGGLQSAHPEGIESHGEVLARLGSKEKMRSTSGFSLPGGPRLEPELGTFVEDPESNVPEDVESEVSSVYDLGEQENITEHFRFGAVEALLTPPIMNTAKRFSSEPDVVGNDEYSEAGPSTQVSQRPLPAEDLPLNIQTHNLPLAISSQSTRSSDLLSPTSPFSPRSHNARSSYMTSNTEFSRMSGLSDFPEPPTTISVISRITGSTDSSSDYREFVPDNRHLVLPARLTREPSHGTFGPSRAESCREQSQGPDIFEEEEYGSSVGHAL